MNLKECYKAMDGDYEDVMGRLPREASIIKFLRRFAENKEFEELKEAVRAENYQRVFELSHDLKGMAANLGIKAFGTLASQICEQTRNRVPDEGFEQLMLQAGEAYDRTIAAIAELEDA